MAKHEYKKGDFVRVTSLCGNDEENGIELNSVHEVVEVDSVMDVYVKFDGSLFCLVNNQIEPAYPKPSSPHPTEREQRIRQMAHEYVVSGSYQCHEAIRVAAHIYDTPIPPPSKP